MSELCTTCAIVGCTLTPQEGCKLYSPWNGPALEIKEKSMKVYYAHCISIYDTPQEARDIELLEELGFEVINPNTPDNTDYYRRHGMSYFLAMALDCDFIAFRALPDGRIPAGVAKEVIQMILNKKPMIELPNQIIGRTISVEETREYLQDVGKR